MGTTREVGAARVFPIAFHPKTQRREFSRHPQTNKKEMFAVSAHTLGITNVAFASAIRHNFCLVDASLTIFSNSSMTKTVKYVLREMISVVQNIPGFGRIMENGNFGNAGGKLISTLNNFGNNLDKFLIPTPFGTCRHILFSDFEP